MSVMPCMGGVRANILLPCKKKQQNGTDGNLPPLRCCVLRQSRHVFYAISAVVCMKNYLIGIDTNEIYLP